MRFTTTRLLRVSAMCLVVSLSGPASAVGLQLAQIPQTDGRTLPGALWYPSLAPVRLIAVGTAALEVAPNAPVNGDRHPLIVMSHGALGDRMGHSDLAIALANAGFIVAAVSHDEFKGGAEFQTVDRARQLHALIDYALTAWPGHNHIDASEIGAFGFSLGGFTVLVAIGGKPNPKLIAPHCQKVPSEWSCQMAGKLDLARTPPEFPAWLADPRIRAAVVAAPALGYVFGDRGLSSVYIPVQLWQAGDDHILAEPWNVKAVQAELPVPPDFHLVEGANHEDFGNSCNATQQASMKARCSGQLGAHRIAQHEAMDQAIVMFFLRALRSPSLSAPQ